MDKNDNDNNKMPVCKERTSYFYGKSEEIENKHNKEVICTGIMDGEWGLDSDGSS